MKRLLTVLLACAFVTVFDCEVVLAQKKKPDFSSYEAKEDWTKKYEHLRSPMEARKLIFSYVHSTGDEVRLENDYRLFGTIKEALEKTWKNRPLKIKIKNGLVFNSNTHTKGEIGSQEFELRILIEAKFRVGKLLYTYSVECTQSGTESHTIHSDLIRKSKFYTEMKTITNKVAKSCPK